MGNRQEEGEEEVEEEREEESAFLAILFFKVVDVPVFVNDGFLSNSGKRWIWRVVEGMEALGTWLDNRGCSEASMWHRISKANFMFYAKRALFCDPKLPVKRRIDAFYSTCVPAALHGAGEWAYTQSMFQALRIWELGKLRRVLCLRRRANECWADHMKRTGVIVVRQLKKHKSTTRANFGYETCSYCCLADGELPERR